MPLKPEEGQVGRRSAPREGLKRQRQCRGSPPSSPVLRASERNISGSRKRLPTRGAAQTKSLDTPRFHGGVSRHPMSRGDSGTARAHLVPRHQVHAKRRVQTQKWAASREGRQGAPDCMQTRLFLPRSPYTPRLARRGNCMRPRQAHESECMRTHAHRKTKARRTRALPSVAGGSSLCEGAREADAGAAWESPRVSGEQRLRQRSPVAPLHRRHGTTQEAAGAAGDKARREIQRARPHPCVELHPPPRGSWPARRPSPRGLRAAGGRMTPAHACQSIPRLLLFSLDLPHTSPLPQRRLRQVPGIRCVAGHRLAAPLWPPTSVGLHGPHREPGQRTQASMHTPQGAPRRGADGRPRPSRGPASQASAPRPAPGKTASASLQCGVSAAARAAVSAARAPPLPREKSLSRRLRRSPSDTLVTPGRRPS
ncbi:hypothetical protein TGDOM2_364850 [Toxoplasma gondii GAB2-2007-GAL-DOM2]|uniref:Uncharacterized protein n=2 Tax=Toxoplasma gondii TaxID=5811 RepID=A0A086L9J4_TOXGO|nr:hypothetical protein TGDOM2_364850 [Toxoplasma gondii GAB2-2007-GAL-DOM2]KFG53312.1 hypothetical protein TGFOU_364850 [Toxoplasma gondii FOU]